MGVAITFYLFRKAVNSTANPHMHPELVERQFTTEIVYKKDMSSVFAPTMNMTGQVLNTDLGTGTYPVPTWNYAYFKGYFYYLTDWEDLGAQNVRFTLRVDSLASVAGSNRLAGQRVYVAYKSFVDREHNIEEELPDARQLISGEYNLNSVQMGSFPNDNGIYSVYIIGSHSTTGYYLMNAYQLGRLMNSVNSWGDTIKNNMTSPLETLGTVGELLMGGGMMAQCIKSVTWLPFHSMSGTDYVPEIYLGVVGTGLSGRKIGDALVSRYMEWTNVVRIPFVHRGWKRRNPYTYVTLHIPYFGTFNIDEPLFVGTDSDPAGEDFSVIHLWFGFDMAVGELTVKASLGSRLTASAPTGEKVLFTSSKQIGINSAWGVQNSPMGNIVGVAASVVGAAVTGGAAAATLAGVTGVINNSPSINGVGGGGAGGITTRIMDLASYLYVASAKISPSRTASGLAGTVGRAYFAPYTLHSLPAPRQYIRTSGANFYGIYPRIMLDEVNKQFDEGIFYE